MTQPVSGTLRHVGITAHDIPARGARRPLPVTGLTVGPDDVRASGNTDQAHARAVDARALLSDEDMSDALGFQISPDTEPGQVKALGPPVQRRGDSEYGGLGPLRQPHRVRGGPRHPGTSAPSRASCARQGAGRARCPAQHPWGAAPAIGRRDDDHTRRALHR
ncbi:LmeA family phospholipid-binding protein [Streptomyces davaonensis]|uniref:LmeA family phospholipid-binding protein n=1 Tax=Streptomyces davaonensis TaxID=348043 RepID=UPI00099812F8